MRGILALDIATKTGFAITNELSGVWDFKIKRDESSGMRLVRFESKVKELLTLQKINLVVYERPAGRHASSVIVASELIGVLKRICEKRGIPYRAYSATEIKKFATGKGNAGKPAMIKAAEDNYGMEIIDDNHADALHIWHMAVEEYGEVNLKELRKEHIKKMAKK